MIKDIGKVAHFSSSVGILKHFGILAKDMQTNKMYHHVEYFTPIENDAGSFRTWDRILV